jgi:hypothetical protein
MAVAVALASLLPGVWLRSRELQHGTGHLMATSWRMLSVMLGMLLMFLWSIETRKYFGTTLVTCYFVGLALESWLQLKQVEAKQLSDRNPR